MFRFYNTGFWLFPRILQALGSSGTLIGTMSTYPGTCKYPGSRVIAKNPFGEIFYQVRYIGGRHREKSWYKHCKLRVCCLIVRMRLLFLLGLLIIFLRKVTRELFLNTASKYPLSPPPNPSLADFLCVGPRTRHVQWSRFALSWR